MRSVFAVAVKILVTFAFFLSFAEKFLLTLLCLAFFSLAKLFVILATFVIVVSSGIFPLRGIHVTLS